MRFDTIDGYAYVAVIRQLHTNGTVEAHTTLQDADIWRCWQQRA